MIHTGFPSRQYRMQAGFYVPLSTSCATIHSTRSTGSVHGSGKPLFLCCPIRHMLRLDKVDSIGFSHILAIPAISVCLWKVIGKPSIEIRVWDASGSIVPLSTSCAMIHSTLSTGSVRGSDKLLFLCCPMRHVSTTYA